MSEKRVDLLVPVSGADVKEEAMAERHAALEGKALGILCNRKHNAGLLLNRLMEQLSGKYNISEVLYTEKDAATPAPESVLDRLKAKCDLVLNAVGD